MSNQAYNRTHSIGNHVERQLGQVGDLYKLSGEDGVYAKSREGSGNYPKLVAGDVLMRLAHSGDCFGYYAVFRDGIRLAAKWVGYDGVGTFIGNVFGKSGPGGIVSDALDVYRYEARK